MAVTRELSEFAEAPERYVDIAPGESVERRDDERRCVVWDQLWATVNAIRIEPDEVDSLIDEVRELVPIDARTMWNLGPSSQPSDLAELLAQRGFVTPDPRPAEVRALALVTEPDAPGDADVRRATTFEEFVEARESAWDAFGAPEEVRAKERGLLREGYDQMKRTGRPELFLAYLDGRIAGSAIALPSSRGVFLGGGSTAPWARGRGLYRALVRARWESAVASGAPALVTHANPKTSYPILLQLGFEEVGTIRRLVDPQRNGNASP